MPRIPFWPVIPIPQSRDRNDNVTKLVEPLPEVGKGSLTLSRAPGATVTRDGSGQVLQGRKQIEGNVGRLKVARVGVRSIVEQRPERRGARGRREGSPRQLLSQRHSSKEASGDALHVSFHTTKLACDKDVGRGTKAEVSREQPGRVDISVAMNLPQAQEFGRFEPGDHAQDVLLLGKLEVVLKPHQVVA